MSCFFTDQTFVCKMNSEFYEFDDKIIEEVNNLETPYFEQLFTGFITMTFALFLSSCIVANYVWKPMRKLDPNDLIEPKIPYCQRYYPIPDKNMENNAQYLASIFRTLVYLNWRHIERTKRTNVWLCVKCTSTN